MPDLFERFSSKENLKLAYKYVQSELAHSTLSINPINHPTLTAINALGDQFFVALEGYLRDEKYSPERGFFVYIPKDNLGLRPVCVLSMVDRIVYQAIFNQDILGNKIDGQISDKSCFAYRLNDDVSDDFFVHYSKGWDAYCQAQTEAYEKGYTWKTEIDVQQYYEHIPIEKLIQNLKNEFSIKNNRILDLLKKQLCTWAEYPELPKGIPQGQGASSILGNAYLSALDSYVETTLAGKKLRYFRYVDDIVLMGKSRKDVLQATEKITHFLRGHNLNLNEKTRVIELTNTETIEAMRIRPEYADALPEMPEDELAILKQQIPDIIATITAGKEVSKPQIRTLKSYLKMGADYDLSFLTELAGIIPLRPSLVVPIIQYLTEGRGFLLAFGDELDIILLDSALWGAYGNDEISSWSKFWILKLLVSSENLSIGEIQGEMRRILGSDEATIFKIVSLYYKAIHNHKIGIEMVGQAIKDAENNVEKSLYSFFLLNAFDGVRNSTIKNYIEKALSSPSPEVNLIGCFLYQSKPQIKIDDIEDNFSSYVLQKKVRGRKVKPAETSVDADYFIIRKESLIPVDSPATILGTNRMKYIKQSVSLTFPEPVKWEKVLVRIKEGMREAEIFYGSTHITTADYVELGFFTGKKTQKQNRLWHFLCAIAMLSATDITQATADKMRAMVAVNSKTIVSTGNVYQIKRSLVKRLRDIFKTEEAPFYEGRPYYEPRFRIEPEPELRRETLWKQGGRLNENLSSPDL